MNDIENAIRSARQAQVDRIYKSFANAEQVTQDEDQVSKGEETTEVEVENPFDAMYKSEEAEIEKAHQDGEIHPNGKWRWDSSAAGGKGDWRMIKNKNSSQTSSQTAAANKQKVAKVKENVQKFLSSNALEFLEYLSHGADNVDEKNVEKFEALKKIGWKAGKIFDSSDYEAAETYVAKMKKEGYEVHEVDGTSDYAYLVKKNSNRMGDNKSDKGGKSDEDEYSEKAEDTDLEKSDIMNAFGYGSDVKVTKTGKEIAEQVDTVVLPALNAKLIEKKSDADDLLAECGNAPTKEVPVWWTGDIKMAVEYKMYDWDETCVPSNEDGGIAGSLSAPDAEEQKVKRNKPENQAQADARRQYNDCLRCICEILVDIKACEILKTLKPGKEYELSPRQVVALQF